LQIRFLSLHKKTNMISYIQFTRKRKSKYNLRTVRTDSHKGFQYAKFAMSEEAIPFIGEIYKNFNILASKTKLRPVQCEVKDNAIYFKKAKGMSFEVLLHDLFTLRKKESFIAMLENYKNILMASSAKPREGDISLRNFFAIDDNCHLDLVPEIPVGCIDISFSNLYYNIQEEKREYTLIDYEWVLPCTVPVKYLLWRSLYMFYDARKHTNLNTFCPILNLYKHFNISLKERKLYIQYEYYFQQYALDTCDYTLDDFVKEVHQCEHMHSSVIRSYTPATKKLITMRRKINKYDIFGFQKIYTWFFSNK